VKTGWVVFEKMQGGELTPGYEAITIFPRQGETSFEAMFKSVFPEFTYKDVFENRNDARAWVDNWKPEEDN
jgi:hypothetical protein